MRADSRWKRFRRRLRYWLAQRAAAIAVGGDGIPYRIDGAGPGRERYVRAGSACGGAQKVWQYDTKIGRSALHLDRAMDERSGAGSEAFVSRDAARCRLHRVCDSHRRPRHRRQFHGIQRGERSAAASTAVPRSRTAGMDCEREEWSTQVEHYSGFAGAEQIILRSGGFAVLWRGRQRTNRNRRAGASDERSRYPELLPVAGCATDDRKIVHRRGVPGKIDTPPAVLVELRLLAAAVCFRPERGGPEADAEQQAGDGGGRAAGVLRFRERFCARHAGGYVHSLAPDGRNEPAWKYHEGDRTG